MTVVTADSRDAVEAAAGEEPLSNLLRQWVADLDPDRPKPWLAWLTAFARSSKWSIALELLYIGRLVLDSALGETSASRRLPLRFLTGMYTCSSATVFLALHSRHVSHTLAALLDVSVYLERRGGQGSKDALASTARFLRRVVLFYYSMIVFELVGVLEPFLRTDDSFVTLALQGRPHGTVVIWVLNVAQLVGMMAGVLALYVMLPVTYISFRACAGLYRALAEECTLSRRHGAAQLRLLSSLHCRITDGARQSRWQYEHLIGHVLSSSLILPLLGTLEFLTALEDVDGLTLVTFIIIVTTLIPVYMTGQELEDASTSVPRHVYAGPWLEEDCPARRFRVQLMLGSGTKARIVVAGLGALNARSCLSVVNRWFSALNVFLNTAGHSVGQ